MTVREWAYERHTPGRVRGAVHSRWRFSCCRGYAPRDLLLRWDPSTLDTTTWSAARSWLMFCLLQSIRCSSPFQSCASLSISRYYFLARDKPGYLVGFLRCVTLQHAFLRVYIVKAAARLISKTVIRRDLCLQMRQKREKSTTDASTAVKKNTSNIHRNVLVKSKLFLKAI